MENEIKLLARHEDLETLLHSPLLQKLATAEAVEHLIVDTYYDTPMHELRAQHATLRLRKSGNEYLQTLKIGDGSDGGLHSREEFELPVKGNRPVLGLLRKHAAVKGTLRALLRSPDLKRQLYPVFTTRIQRTLFLLHLPQGDVVECAVDVGEISANGATVPVCEVELELKSGTVARLFDLALALADEVPLTIGELSKGDRGFALLAPQVFEACKATPVTLKKNMTVEHAFTDIVGNCITHIEANAPGVAHCDSEALHQMRVGLRRLRAALDLVEDMIALPPELGAEMAWLAADLGAARDWDVLAQTTLGELARAHPVEPHISRVAQAALDESEQSRRVAAAAVASPRYARLLLLLTQWRLGTNWRNHATAHTLARLDSPVSRFARKTLASSHKRLLKRGARLDGAAPEATHRVRIAAKKTRYASEFFRSLFPAGKVRSFVKRLSGLQDEFGKLNDMAVADQLLATLGERQPALGGSADYVRGFLARGAESGPDAVKKSWRKFTPARLPH
jgi:triphosphatase